MHLFGSSAAKNAADKLQARTARASSGWAALLKELGTGEGQRVLDIGPTSSTNINFLTGLGHSVYMADLLGELRDPRWAVADGDEFATEAFVSANLDFSGRRFDTVLFWDAGDYMPIALREAVVERIHQVMEPGGKLLALFHVKPDQEVQRYHLRDDGQVDIQFTGRTEQMSSLNNRQIEQLFGRFSTYRFFLAKDNLREVLVTR